MKFCRAYFILTIALAAMSLHAQVGPDDLAHNSDPQMLSYHKPLNTTWHFQKGGAWYFSWGYSRWWYPKTDIHFKMDYTDANTRGVHSEFTMKDCYAHDLDRLNKLFVEPLTVPQFCVRVGYFFNANQTLGIELTYDHSKFLVVDKQDIRMVGTTNGVPFDSIAHIYPEDYQGPAAFFFKLNNGANFFEFTLVRRWELYSRGKKLRFFYHLKPGVGWNTPHVENEFFGVKNRPHFQPIGGWNVGVESTVRLQFWDRLYLECGQKFVYAAYYHLDVPNGRASVHFPTYGLIFSLGLNFPGKANRQYSNNIE